MDARRFRWRKPLDEEEVGERGVVVYCGLPVPGSSPRVFDQIWSNLLPFCCCWHKAESKAEWTALRSHDVPDMMVCDDVRDFFPGSFIPWFRAFCFMPLLQCWGGWWGGCWVGGGGCVCSYLRRDQEEVVVIHTLGNLFPPSISTSVWSVNTPSFFSQTPPTQPVLRSSFLCERGHRRPIWGPPIPIVLHCTVSSPSAGSHRPEPLSLHSGFFFSNMISGGCAQELALQSEEPRRGQGASLNAFLVVRISPVLSFHPNAKPLSVWWNCFSHWPD